MRTKAGKKIMLTLFLVSVLTILFNIIAITASSGNVMVAVYGSTPTIDGSVEDGEWDDASTVTVPISDGANCTVYAKQDGFNFYVGVSTLDVTYGNSDSCVVIFDVNHDGSISLQTDDIWLRISRTGATQEYNVTAGGWFPTAVYGWAAEASSTSNGWQCEYNITYAKLGVTAGANKTLGVMFLIVDENVEMGWYVWPSDASIISPVSWGDIVSMDMTGFQSFPHGHQCFFYLLCLQLP